MTLTWPRFFRYLAIAIVVAAIYVGITDMAWPVFLQLLIAGLVFGSIYGMVALSYNILFSTRNIINFAQGELVVVGMLLGWTLYNIASQPWLIALVLSTVVVVLISALIDYIAVRPAGNVKTNFVWIMSTFGFGIALKELATFVWGREPLRFPKFIGGDIPMTFGSITILPQELAIILLCVAVTVGYVIFTRSSIYGTAIRAVSIDRDTAGLMGINPEKIIFLAYALSGAIAAIAGFFIAPITFADPQYGIVLAISGFIAAVIGGLGNVWGGFIGGLMLGLLENFSTGLFPVEWKQVFVFAFLLLVMVFRPSGLFAKS